MIDVAGVDERDDARAKALRHAVLRRYAGLLEALSKASFDHAKISNRR